MKTFKQVLKRIILSGFYMCSLFAFLSAIDNNLELMMIFTISLVILGIWYGVYRE